MEYKDELIDIYGYQAEIFSKSYYMMGRLLDKCFVKNEIERRKWSDIYIYGGGYLGIQLYRAMSPMINVLSIVDKKGRLIIDSLDDILIMDMDTFRKQYKNQPVIVTPLKFYREIYHELREFVAEDEIIFLEEFGGR
jgi:hypothetical protein